MLSANQSSTGIVHAARVCACGSCQRLARRAADALLATLAFDLSYRALHCTKTLTIGSMQLLFPSAADRQFVSAESLLKKRDRHP